MVQLIGKSMAIPQKIIDFLYDLTTPPLGIYSKKQKAGSQRDICIHIRMAALFLIAKRLKQPK